MALTSAQKSAASKTLSRIASQAKAISAKVSTMSASQRASTASAIKQATSGVQSAAKSYRSGSSKPKVEAYTPADMSERATVAGLPDTPQTPDYGDVINPVMTALAPGLTDMGYSVDQKTGMTTPPVVDPNANTQSGIFSQYMQAMGQIQKDTPQAADIFAQTQKDVGQKQYQADVSNYTGQLNQIIAKRDADMLSVTGQGRGIPEVIIGGQQAQINKEAAIRALPIQAMLATAQGNLEMANQQLTQLYQVRMADVQSQTNFKMGVVNALFDFANKKEQRQFETIQANIARNDANVKMNISRMDEWAKMAVQTGQTSLVGQINALDPKSETFDAEFSALTGKISIPKQATTENTGTWSITKLDDGSLVKINSKTGEIVPYGTATSGAGDTAQSASDQLSFLRETIKDALNLKDASGVSGFWKKVGDWTVGDTEYRRLEALTNTLRTNVLTLVSDPDIKKFFGPQMSEADVRLMTAAGTTLNPDNQSPTDLAKELGRLDDIFNRLQTAAQSGGQNTGVELTGADGLQYIIVD